MDNEFKRDRKGGIQEEYRKEMKKRNLNILQFKALQKKI